MVHDPWHELLELVAAAVLSVGGGVFVILSVIERRRTTSVAVERIGPPQAEVSSVITILAAALSLAAAAIHLAAAPAHLDELGALGWGFVLAAAFQASWALAYGIQPSRGIARLATAGNLAIATIWLLSRTVGLPVGPLAGAPEPVGTPDAAATAFELLLVGLLAARWFDAETLLARRVRDARSILTIALVPAVGVVFLATTLAVSLALGHSHVAH